MSKLKIIQSLNLFTQFWNLMTFSFPEVERRDCEGFAFICKNDAFAIKSNLGNNSDLEYFITHWELKNFIYIEHFAISHHLRGKGMGSSILKDFIKKNKRPIVLEVEPPVDSILRAVGFYTFSLELPTTPPIAKAMIFLICY